METKKMRRGLTLEGEDVINLRDWGDGGPVGAYFGCIQLIGYCSAWVAPAHLIGPAMKSGMRATFVGVQPAGVEVTHQDSLIA